ncbi:threonine aldolase family protein [Oceanidesulfovibrio marinus]|uniref:Threonine aldolase n=1 Tax=Oceanidesulfovibrio marinus TaxID=370038 RepID=A0A6P1ZE43_9BACT|nr:low specificity L-threonine aldolase [Oceanidesulfovibrio marinus]QJT10869.1 low specificity L-threonine aldolase [Oceanidesulfovibrio marinus]TVM30528.1 threonine aldolase [Oceanidesulfovibrio marinus]
MRSFASDNNAGVHPRVMEALLAANKDHAVGYGDDEHSRRARETLKRHFGDDSQSYFVFLGTAANVLGLSALVRSYQSVICAQTAHINVDEGGAPERFLGSKLIGVPHTNGKITPEAIAPALESRGFEHHSQPAAVSITQPTELGALYSLEELAAIGEFCKREGLRLHMDGARISNAAAALGVSLAELTRDVGVDVLSLGGCKNGLMYGEAVVFMRPGLDTDFRYMRKQAMQLGSKMRYLSAQIQAMYGTDLWIENGRHANAMAQLLGQKAGAVDGVEITRPIETNAVFATMPLKVIERLREEFYFYVWEPTRPEVRWMTSFDTTEDDVETFVAALQRAVAA